MNTASKALLVFGASAFLGALIWPLSPAFTGHREPWDANSIYYWVALALAGFIPACFSGHSVMLCAIGAYLGQVASFLFIMLASTEPAGGLWPIGLVLMCLYSLLGLLGAALGAGVHRHFRGLFRHAR